MFREDETEVHIEEGGWVKKQSKVGGGGGRAREKAT